MYNVSAAALGSTGAATLAATGMGLQLPLVTSAVLAVVAIGGVLLLVGSRISKKKVENELG